MTSGPPSGGRLSFNWLWLTDLHFGQKDQNWLWPTHRDDFFADLRRMHKQSGPWDAVVFTGDLVFSGKPEEFDALTKLLRQMWGVIKELQGDSPVLMTVPGNHDLARPDPKSSATVALRHWWEEAAVQQEFWDNPSSDYRRLINDSTTTYTEWHQNHGFPVPAEYQDGLLPGDFSAVLTKGEARLGFMGLNTTFLQLTGEDYKGKLALNAKQAMEACGGDQPEWLAKNHASILLTHQPPDWLHSTANKVYEGVVYRPGDFAAHFYGHMHEARSAASAFGGGEPRRQFQGSSLYGLERFGEAFDKQRFSFGYAAVRVEIDGGMGRLILWPRKAEIKQSGEWRLGPDISYQFDGDTHHTPPATFALKMKCDSPAIAAPPAGRVHSGAADSMALFVLQECTEGLPGEVMCEVTHLRPEQLRASLGPFVDADRLQSQNEYQPIANSITPIARDDSDDLRARTLELLIGYIDQHKSDGLGSRYVDTAIALAKRCKAARPAAVAGLFNAVDRILKRRGDKRKVLEVANLTIEASKEASHELRPVDDVRREAKALICGRSWVYQRIGRLAEARADAERSLALGKKSKWDRNTAFCNKCMGRIYRLLAVEECDTVKRHALFKQSIDSLREAVITFKGMSEIGPNHPEVGDCYSLVARTFLVAGQHKEARTYLDKARERIIDENDKDYMDYLILEGDYAAACGRFDEAEAYYDTVIQADDAGDCEKSEIRARAFYQRAESRASQKKFKASSADLEQAATIWDNLQERKASAKARWRKIVLDGQLSSQSISQLAGASDTVKVIAVRLHEAKLAAYPNRGPRRKEPDRNWWEFILAEANSIDARQDLDW